MRIRTTLVALAAVSLAACTTAVPVTDAVPTPQPVAVVAVPSSSPSASVLAIVIVKPTPKPAPKATPKATVKPKPKRVIRRAAPKPTGWVCYVGKPCKVPAFTSPVWHVTVGCTVAWRKALHRTTCPPGWPPIP